jgi:hypothetical protein
VGRRARSGIRELVYQRSLPLATRGLTILTSKLGENAGVLGAAQLVIETRLEPAAIDATLATLLQP